MVKYGYILLIMAAVLLLSACGRSQKGYDRVISDAERVVESHGADSAMAMLEQIDPADMKHDSLRAKYVYVTALAHVRQNRSMVGDSLIGMAHEYYRSHGDLQRSMRCALLTAWYRFWTDDTPGAIAMLDSLTRLEGVADSLIVEPLRLRVLLGASQYQGEDNIAPAKRLVEVETDSLRRMEAQYCLVSAYEYAGCMDTALVITEGLIDLARENGMGDKHFIFEAERAQLLSELGRYDESNKAIDEIFRKAPGNGVSYILYMFKAFNHFNKGETAAALRHLSLADSLSAELGHYEDMYYQSYSRVLHTVADYSANGKLSLSLVAQNNNRQQEYFNRLQASQWESERSALKSESRSLALKAESKRKTIVILVIILVSVIVTGSLVFIIKRRRRRELEGEERAEALQKMVDEFRNAPKESCRDSDTLRRAMLQQLGIVKMVAETPTEQNREMLRRISSIGAEIGDNLVNWHNLYDVIDNLYSGFYTRLRERYGELLTEKETQIIVLMAAGFSTKEMSVVTSQTTATIYVRKSAIRRKLGIAEKEDIMAFLRREPAG